MGTQWYSGTVTGTSVNAATNVLTWDTHKLDGSKTIVIGNGLNTIDYTIYGTARTNSSGAVATVVTTAQLAANTNYTYSTSNSWAQLFVSIRSNSNGSNSAYTVDYCGVSDKG